MNLSTLKRFSITFCMMLLAFGIGFAQTNGTTPDWNFSCNDNSYVEIIGTGMQTPGAPPSVINISNIANVDSIMIEIIFKGPYNVLPHAAIIQTSNGDSIYNDTPVAIPSLGSNHLAGAFRNTISPASTITAYVTPPLTASSAWAMLAYVYRSGNAIGSTSSGVYMQPLILNTNWVVDLPIPVTAVPKTVEILTPIVDLDNMMDRMAIVSVITSGAAQIDTIYIPNAGQSLNMHTIILNNVAAAASKVTVDFISPNNGTGDSFMGAAMVTVRNSCADPLSLIVDAKTNITCAGGNNGSIDVHGINGIPPYTFLWNDGATTEDRANLSAGTYTVTITDSQGNTDSKTRNIYTIPQMQVSAVRTNITCSGTSNGSIDLNVTSGTAPYTFMWNDGMTSEDRQNLNTGTYTVTVTDANGCSKQLTRKVNQPSKLAIQMNRIHNTCFESNDGSIDASTRGGLKPYTFLWNDGNTSEDRIGLAKGTYTLTVTDANGCTTSTHRMVNQPRRIIANSTITEVNCYGESNGSISLIVTGGNGNYTYSWNNGAVTKNISSLAAGRYHVDIIDVKGCRTARNIDVIQPAPLQVSVSKVDVSCFGQSTGIATAIANGGNQNYTYTWSNGIIASQNSNLAAGTYSVLVTDVKGCTISSGETISQPAQLTANAGVIDVLCFGESNGSIDLVVSGGIKNYAYNWSNNSHSSKINNLSAGVYTVTITDANGCSLTSSASVQEPAQLVANSVNSNLACFGQGNGSATVAVNGGIQNYVYSWSNGSTLSQINNLIAGTYSVLVTDANGCTSTSETTLTEPAQLVVETDLTDVTCNGGSDGEVRITVIGGSAPFNYNWSNNTNTLINSNLTIGNYTVTVTDANGCESISHAQINQPEAMSASTLIANVSCKNGSNGYAEVLVVNGKSPFSYNWSNAATTNTINNLAAGVYSVTISDVNGCTAASTAEINEPLQALSALLNSTQPICNGDANAEITCTATGGDTPYMYAWNTGDIVQSISGLAAGTYTLTITDSRGCSLTSSTTVIDPSLLTLNAVGQDALCSGTNSGAIDITVAGGNPGYIYEWSNGATSEDLVNIASGTYTVTVTDFSNTIGCSVSESVTITSTPAVQVTTCPSQEVALMPGPEVDCHYPQVLNVVYNGVAGTTVKVYLETPPNKLLNTYTNVQLGQVLSTSSMNVGENKFKSRTYFTVDNGVTIETYEAHTSCSVPLLGLDFGDFHVTGFQNANGTSYDEATSGPKASVTATALASGGTAPYTYAWNNTLNGSIINFNVAQNTLMYVTVTDANGCTASATHQVNVVDIRSANYPNKVIMCHDPLTNPHTHNVEIKDIAKKLGEGYTLGPCGYDFSQPNACGSFVELPCECKGGIQAMALIYDGPAGASVDFYNDDAINASKLIKSFTNVQPGDSLLAYSVEIGENKFSKFGVVVNGIFLTDFHISCSVPVQGLTAGDLTVYGFVDGYDNVCHMPAPPVSATCDCDGKIIEMTVIYDGPANATVSVGPNSSGTNPFVKTGVNPGDTLVINLGNIGNDWYYIVNGTQDAYMHASCSDEIMGNVNASKSDFGSLGNYPNPETGNNLGTFLVIGHIDESGNVCTLQNYNPRYAAPGAVQSKLEVDFISIFPNPSTGSVTLEYIMNANTNVEIEVLDFTGRTVILNSQLASEGMNSLHMDLNHLANGVYFVKLNNTLESKTLKFVIQK